MNKIKRLQLLQVLLVVVIIVSGLVFLGDVSVDATSKQLSILIWTKIISSILIFSSIFGIKRLERLINKLI